MSSFIERFDSVERAAELWNKGYTYSEIGRELGITHVVAKGLIQDYKGLLQKSVDDDPDFLSRVKENTLESIDELKLIQKKTWDAIEHAEQNEMVSALAALLKLATDVSVKKGQLHQLYGASANSSDITKLRRLEQVNEIISSVLKEIIAECDHCRREAQIKIAEAFQLMDKGSEVAELKEVPSDDMDDIVEAEVVEDHNDIKISMMKDIIEGD